MCVCHEEPGEGSAVPTVFNFVCYCMSVCRVYGCCLSVMYVYCRKVCYCMHGVWRSDVPLGVFSQLSFLELNLFT